MATANQVPESSMEEILASIRKIISEDEAKLSETTPDIAAASLPKRPASNVSRLFGDDMSGRIDEPVEPPDATDEGEAREAEPPSDRFPAPAHYPEFGESDEIEANPGAADAEDGALDDPPQAGALLSPRADAAVASAFNHLASTILSNNTRTIEQMAEDMMRPLLKDWLDENLPPLVERLVREEIERVSRRR